MVALGRPLLADSEIPNKIMLDRYNKVRPCLSCQESCMGRLQNYANNSEKSLYEELKFEIPNLHLLGDAR